MTTRESRAPTTYLLVAALVALTGLALLLALGSRGAPRLAASNTRVHLSRFAVDVPPGGRHCQGGEHVPRVADRVRLFPSNDTEVAPIAVEIYGEAGDLEVVGLDGTEVERGELVLDLPPRRSELQMARLCVVNHGQRPAGFAGNLTPLNPEAVIGPNGYGKPEVDEIRADYFRPGRESYLSLFGTMAERAAIFKPSFAGAWLLPALAGMAIAVGAVAIGIGAVAVTEPELIVRRRRLAAVACALPGLGFASIWALLMPPMQQPDEIVHVEYAEHIASHGRLPRASGPADQRDFRSVGRDTQGDEQQHVFAGMPFSSEGDPSWSPAAEELLDADLRDANDVNAQGAGNAGSNPPLYYAVEALTVKPVMAWHPLNRLLVLRLTSAVLGAATAVLIFGFLAEVMPGSPVAWVLGGLAASLQPVFSSLSAGVNNDNFIYLAGAALFLALARVLRRGLQPRTGVWVGVALGLGAVAKTRFLLLVPPIAVVLLLALVTSSRGVARRNALLGAVAAGLAFVAIEGGWLVSASTVFGHSTAEGDVARQPGDQVTTLQSTFDYVWQSFLPRPPFMDDAFEGGYPQYPLWDVYTQGLVGRFGYFQYGYAPAVNALGAGLLVALVARAAVVVRAAAARDRRRILEVVSYTLVIGALAVMLAALGHAHKVRTNHNLEQTRYLLPCLALYAAVVGAAIVGLRERWRAGVMGLVVGLGVVHTWSALALTVTRYYS